MCESISPTSHCAPSIPGGTGQGLSTEPPEHDKIREGGPCPLRALSPAARWAPASVRATLRDRRCNVGTACREKWPPPPGDKAPRVCRQWLPRPLAKCRSHKMQQPPERSANVTRLHGAGAETTLHQIRPPIRQLQVDSGRTCPPATRGQEAEPPTRTELEARVRRAPTNGSRTIWAACNEYPKRPALSGRIGPHMVKVAKDLAT